MYRGSLPRGEEKALIIKLMLGALLVSICLKAIETLVERIGERHPASLFWNWAYRCMDRFGFVFGWFGRLVQRIVFTREGR